MNISQEDGILIKFFFNLSKQYNARRLLREFRD